MPRNISMMDQYAGSPSQEGGGLETSFMSTQPALSTFNVLKRGNTPIRTRVFPDQQMTESMSSLSSSTSSMSSSFTSMSSSSVSTPPVPPPVVPPLSVIPGHLKAPAPPPIKEKPKVPAKVKPLWWRSHRDLPNFHANIRHPLTRSSENDFLFLLIKITSTTHSADSADFQLTFVYGIVCYTLQTSKYSAVGPL